MTEALERTSLFEAAAALPEAERRKLITYLESSLFTDEQVDAMAARVLARPEIQKAIADAEQGIGVVRRSGRQERPSTNALTSAGSRR